jgi:hypothetical protein
MASYRLHPIVPDYVYVKLFLPNFVKISWTDNRPFARLLATQDNRGTEESRHARSIDSPIGFRIREISDGPDQIMHIFNRTIPAVGVPKNCLILKLSSKHDHHPQGCTNLRRYAHSRADNVMNIKWTHASNCQVRNKGKVFCLPSWRLLYFLSLDHFQKVLQELRATSWNVHSDVRLFYRKYE